VVSLEDNFDERNMADVKNIGDTCYQGGTKIYSAESVNINIPKDHFKFIRSKSALPM
jgi:hypothetical protein